jgi:hypothetical protein
VLTLLISAVQDKAKAALLAASGDENAAIENLVSSM